MVGWRCLAVCGLLWPALVLAKSSDALMWLERMEQAQQESYQGIFIHEQRNGLLHSLNVLHLADEQGVREYLQYLDGPERTLVRRGDQLAYLEGSRSDQDLAPLLGGVRTVFSEFERLQTHYQVRVAGNDRVADRAAVVVDVIPQDRHRYGLRIWLDQASGLLLKNLVIDPDDGVLERMQFTQLTTQADLRSGGQGGATFKEPSIAEAVTANVSSNTASTEKTSLPWKAGWVPAGFELLRQGEQASEVVDSPVSTFVYSDGLANFSIFIEANLDPVLNDDRQRKGATSVLSKVMYHQDRYYLVTVVGEIPLGAAERIAVSVQENTLKAPES